MHGCGNDFILIDNRTLAVPVERMSRWARALCPRACSVGADGLVFLENPQPGQAVDYRWHFYNADGSRAEMCGNASRCVATLAVRLGLAGPVHTLGTDAGPIAVQVLEDGQVKVQLTPPTGLQLNISLPVEGAMHTGHFVNTGVPHLVVVCADVAAVDVKALGRALRHHPYFQPAGTNANFIQVIDRDNLELRTYERGVEDETFACGTGAVASLLAAHALGLTGPAAAVTTTGRERLLVSVRDEKVFLQGRAVLVYTGTLSPSSFGLHI